MKTVLLAVSLLAAASAHANTYSIDPSHTAAFFAADHNNTSTNRGRLPGREGSVTFDRAGKSGKADIVIDVSALQTGVPGFDKVLKGPDMFNVEQHPTARFVADRFGFDADKVSEVAGTLTMLGKAQPVTLKATRFGCYQHSTLKREVCGGDFEATIRRSLWGMTWGLNFGAPDEVKLTVQIEAIKQQ